jgi:hypothetical protein
LLGGTLPQFEQGQDLAWMPPKREEAILQGLTLETWLMHAKVLQVIDLEANWQVLLLATKEMPTFNSFV